MKKKPTVMDEVLRRLNDMMGALLTVQGDVLKTGAGVQRDLLDTRKEFYKLEERVEQKLNTLSTALLPKPVPVHERLCRDCKYAVPEKRERTQYRVWRSDVVTVTLDYNSAKCGHPLVLSPVSGDANEYCSVQRKDYGPSLPSCGTKGTRFDRLITGSNFVH